MAYRNSAHLLPPLLLGLLFVYSSASPTIKASQKLIDSICHKTQNPEFCRTTLLNNPDTRTANMKQLGLISITIATAQARLNKYVVTDLLEKEKDPAMKNHLSDCQVDYTVTLGKLMTAYNLSDKEDYNMMRKQVGDAMKTSHKCEDGFKRVPIRISPMTDYNQKMVWKIDIAQAILQGLGK